jgi:putative aldouronate transport system substrate-binding protein
MQDLDKALRTIKAGEGPNFYPYMANKDTGTGWYNNEWDNLTATNQYLIGVRMNDQTRRVQVPLEQPETLEEYRIARAWYKDGIFNPDAPQLAETPRGAPLLFDIAWPGKAVTHAIAQGIEAYVPIDLCTPFITTGQVRGSLNCIGVNSRYKNEALKLLQLVNTDHKFRDMLAYGIEGKHFQYVSSNVVRRLTDNYLPYEWCQGTFFNLSTTVDQAPDTWEEVKRQNERAVASQLLGFSFDTTSVQNEIANINTVAGRYSPLYDSEEPETLLPKILAEVRAVGFDKVMAEAQRQIDAYFK